MIIIVYIILISDIDEVQIYSMGLWDKLIYQINN
jgi:hypothetical protein